jgi:hypothetical protein
MSASCPRNVPGAVSGSHEKPRQHGPIDEANGSASTPGLHERHRDNVLNISRRRDEPNRMPSYPIGVPVKNAPKGQTVPGASITPVRLIRRFRLHTL